jgi:muramoyltetrapeptide carboxypeptidase LdcA involved in peptidoglycan recycling
VRWPAPLRPGDLIGITSPSSGVSGAATQRVEFVLGWLTERGYRVRVGECMDGSSHVSAPKASRAAELTAMLCDPEIRAVVPPWGGETAIDLLDQIDWDAIANSAPTWLVGYSDMSTILLPLTLRCGIGTLHGDNLADTPYEVPDGLLHWLDVASATGPFVQRDSELVAGFVRFEEDSRATRWQRVGQGSWSVDGGGGVDVRGRLIGGCLDVVAALAGTPYAPMERYGRMAGADGLIVYLEVCEDNAYEVARKLHGLRYAGWFDNARAVLMGRTNAPDGDTLTQRGAVLDALGDLGIPLVFDLEIGHVPPHLPLVNGALARVVVDGDRREITQTLD